MESKCCHPVWSKVYYKPLPCGSVASVEREGKAYCKKHDPVAVAEKEAKRQADFEEKYYQNFKVGVERKTGEEIYAFMKQSNPEYVRETMLRILDAEWNSKQKRRLLAELGAEEEANETV